MTPSFLVIFPSGNLSPFLVPQHTSPRKGRDQMGSGSHSKIIGNQNCIFLKAEDMQSEAPPSRLFPCGPNRFESDLRAMTGRTLSWYWKVMWAFVSPLLIIGLFIFYLSDYILAGTMQYQAWDATQVCDVPAGLRKRAEPTMSLQNTALQFLIQGTIAVLWGGYR